MKYKNNLLIIVFGVILIFPVFASFLKIDKNLVLSENRELAFKPLFGFYEKFPGYFTNYFSDHFGLRNRLIITDRWMRYKLFGVSPNNAITIGKANWLFYTPDINYIDTVNAQPFSLNDLEQIKNNLLTIQNNFQKQNIKFYFLVAPNKQSVYPENLPNYMKKVRPDSRLDQLTSFLKNYPEISFINPKDELIQAKNQSPVYLKYDTHWNEMGAFVAYHKLFQTINQDFKTIQAKDINDFITSQKEAPNNDLAMQMGVEGNFKENETVFENKNQVSKIVMENCPKIYTNCPLTVRGVSNPKLPKLVMFRDSFGVGLIPFISEHFQRSYYYWGSVPFSYSIIEKEKPDIVIMELTERELWRLKDKLFEF